MAKYIREVEVDAIQFTGGNWKTVQDFVGHRTLDPAGNYSYPLFDDANIWLPNRGEPEVFTAVIQVRGTWQLVKPGDWIVRDPEDPYGFSVFINEDFVANFGEPAKARATSRRTARKKS